MPFGGALTVGLIGAGGSIFGGLLGKSAAQKAAEQEAQSAKAGLDFQKEIWGGQQQNLAPFRAGGETSLAALMDGLKNGSFGFGTVPLPQGFQPPTLDDARNSPGYQFTQEQGNKGILQGASAAGGAITGGTLKALDKFNTGLAETTYGDVFNQSLSTYNAGLQQYQAQLAGQGQAYGELFNTANLGEAAAAGLNNTGAQVAGNVGNLMTQIGNAQAAGTVGGTNALISGIGGATNNALQSVLLGNLFKPAGNGLGVQGLPGNYTSPDLTPAINGAIGLGPG